MRQTIMRGESFNNCDWNSEKKITLVAEIKIVMGCRSGQFFLFPRLPGPSPLN